MGLKDLEDLFQPSWFCDSEMFLCIFLHEEDLKPQVPDCDDVNGHNIPCWDVVV